MKLEAISSSETSFLTRATRRHIPEDDTLHSHSRENPTFSLISFPRITFSSGDFNEMYILNDQ
jgi:hypothetical protein